MNILFLLLTIFSVFLFYFHTIFYGVKLFDEITPFKETYLPVCFSLSEMFELISKLGLHQHFEATNTLYSNIVSLRCNPFGNLLQLFIQFLFKKNVVNYHLYSLLLHLINTGFVFLIIKNIPGLFDIKSNSNKIILFFTSIMTLLWAFHPANIESVLLLTNANIALSYKFSFAVLYFYINKLVNHKEGSII